MHAMLRMIAIAAVMIGCNPAQAAEVVDATIYTTQGEVPLKLELAATPETRVNGLMNRDSIAPLDGMLFVFPTAQDISFWMKDTRISLDMLFICEKRSIVHIEKKVAPYSHTARGANRDDIIALIELDGGRAERESIEIGDYVRYDVASSQVK